MRTYLLSLAVLTGVALTGAGCQKGTTDNKPKTGSGSAVADKAAGSGSASMAPAVPATPPKDIDSKDILARTDTAPEVTVKHVLIGWKDLAGAYRGHMDPRAMKRTNDEAAQLAQDTLAKLKANPDAIDQLSKDQSEDPGSQSGDPYTVKADSPFVPEFKNLSLRLKEKEAGIVKTNFGYHVIERVSPPPPDPLESHDILTRKPNDGLAQVQFILISWKDTPLARAGRDPKAAARSKEDADKLVKDVFEKAKKGDFKALAAQYSEEPAPNKPGKIYDVDSKASSDEPFRDLALRLNLNEVGLQKTQYGWLIVKHVPPPPPDPLESADILKRQPETQNAEVKHILLGWADVNAGDERAKKRDRATLEKLVKDTVAKLKKGDKIEPMMAELSEDPGSAKDGKSYPVTPDAGLVPPFKNLSLRLKVGEVGVVKTDFGIHIIERIK